MRALPATLAAVAIGAAAAASIAATGGGEPGRYRIVFDSAFGVVEGADFKVAGVSVGEVERLTLTEGFPAKAAVVVAVEEAGIRSLRADARCEIRPQSLIGEYFVTCDPGQSSRPLPGDTVPVEQTSGTIPLDVIGNTLRRPYRARLRIIVQTLGASLAGRPEDLSEVLRRAHPGLRETNQVLEALAEQDRVISRFIADAETVIAALEDRKEDVARFAREAGETAAITASRRRDLALSFDRLPAFLAELEPTMAELGDLAEAQVPLLRALRSGSGELERTLELLDPFLGAGEPALVSLGELSEVGIDALRSSDEEVAELRELSQGAPELAGTLRRYLETLDTRERSIEIDPRAAETDPPAPDPTHIDEGDRVGFTGFESLLNYFYWQTLSINGFDRVSHVLRFTGYLGECAHYFANPTKEEIEECNSWLGPYQPGITAPDPTEAGDPIPPEDGPARAALRDAQDPPPGERDPSKPRRVVPELAREPPGMPRAPADRTQPGPPRSLPRQLLDYLLGP